MTGGRPPGPPPQPLQPLQPVQPPPAAECYGDTCITCSDVAVEVRIVRLLPDEMAVVDTGQGEEEVSVALVTAAAGDTILVHASEAIAVIGR